MTEQIELPKDATEFKEWRARMGLSLTEAGKALGVSRRTITNYQNGSTPVTGTIKKLCAVQERDNMLGIPITEEPAAARKQNQRAFN